MQPESQILFRLSQPRRGLYPQLLLAWVVIVIAAMGYCWAHSLVAGSLPHDGWVTVRWAALHWGAWPLLLPVCFWVIRRLQRRISGLLAIALGAPVAVIGSAAFAYAIDRLSGGQWDGLQALYYMTPVAGGTYLLFVMIAFWLLSPATLSASHEEIEVDAPGALLDVSTGTEDRRIRAEQIHWIRGARNYAELHTADAGYIMRSSLRELESLLSSEGFIRVHRSYLVNSQVLDTVALRDGSVVRLPGGVQVPVGRTYRSRVMQALSAVR